MYKNPTIIKQQKNELIEKLTNENYRLKRLLQVTHHLLSSGEFYPNYKDEVLYQEYQDTLDGYINDIERE